MKFLFRNKLFIIALIFFGFGVATRNAWAASANIYFTPASSSPKLGESFNVDIGVNTGGEGVTAVKAYLNFDKDKLIITGFDRSASVFPNWWEATYDNDAGWVHLQATTPSPGYSGEGGLLVRVNFQSKAEGIASLTAISESLILNADDNNLFTAGTAGSYQISSASNTSNNTGDTGDNNNNNNDSPGDNNSNNDTGGPSGKIGDVNSDGAVEITDLSLLLSQWGSGGSADFNRDGVVDVTDLSMLLSNWGL